MQRLSSFFTIFTLTLLICLSQCSQDDSNLKSQRTAVRKFDHLLSDKMTTFDKAVTLRRLVADTLDTGFTSDSLCLNFHTISFEDFATDSFLKKFADNSGAGYCGLAASILCKTLNDHGINAYTYNFGFKGTRFTHVLVVAQTDDNEWTVHDPYFNYSITDSLGEPLDFFLMMENLALKNHSNLLFSTDTVTRDVHVNDMASFKGLVSQTCQEYLDSQDTIPRDSMIAKLPVCYTCSFDPNYCPELNLFFNLSQRMNQFNLPSKSIYGLLFQINGVWGPDPIMFQNKLDSAFEKTHIGSITGQKTYPNK